MNWTREDFERVADDIAVRLSVRGVRSVAFPARRSDEKGWFIGATVGGVQLTNQPHFIADACDGLSVEDHINNFVAALVGIAGGSTLMSALPPRVVASNVEAHYIDKEGLYLRFVNDDNNQRWRCDAIVGRKL